MPAYYQFGKFAASHGVKGDLILVHSLGKKTNLKGVEALFIETSKDQFLPYFVENVKAKTADELFIKLEGVDTMEQARLLTPKSVWLSEKDFHAQTKSGSVLSLLGFELFDRKKSLGIIEEVIEQPHQLLCVIRIKGVEVMVPVHDNNLINMDPKKKRVEVEVPEGLVDVYLNK
jgi:16S rRNA processing protein RimM